MSTRTNRRALWRQAHLWLALLLGWVFALLGASGAVLVLRAPLLEWEVGAAALTLQARPAPGTPMAPPEAWKQAARQAYPQFARIQGAAPPRAGFLTSDNALVFGPVQGRRAMGIAMLDPYSAAPRGFFVYDDLWLAKAVALHRGLLLPPGAGSVAVALCGLALLASLASGIWLWWPRKASAKAWRAALWPRLRPLQGAAPWRGLHNAGAGWLLLPLLVITATGVWLARPDWFGASARSSIKPVLSALHGALMLGTAGQALALAAGLALPLLYATGLAMWLRRRGLSKT
jgi:uncharacterized iron-regulated membrane protein